jgi:hypothetical protein
MGRLQRTSPNDHLGGFPGNLQIQGIKTSTKDTKKNVEATKAGTSLSAQGIRAFGPGLDRAPFVVFVRPKGALVSFVEAFDQGTGSLPPLVRGEQRIRRQVVSRPPRRVPYRWMQPRP